MTAFRFEAVRADGGRVRGTLEAAGADAALTVLNARGLFPVTVTSESAGSRVVRVPAHAVALSVRSLAALVGAGVPLAAALRATRGVVAGVMVEVLQRVEARVRDGSSLGSALAAEPGAFSAITVGLVRAGENGVGLAAALERAAADLERRLETVARVRAALTYPLVMLVVGSFSLLAILTFVVPRFAGLLADVAVTLPASTRALLATSQLLRAHGPVLVLGVLAIVAAAFLAVRRRADDWHRWLLGVPLIGSARHAFATARVARALGALLDGATPALAALRIAGDAAGDREVRRRLVLVGDRVAQGTSLSRALELEGAFTPLAAQLAAIGDGAGRLPELLLRAADLEEQRAEQSVRGAVALIEPALIVAFALCVAFVAAALLQAVYSVRPGLTS